MDDYIVGIDISTSKVCGVVGTLDSTNEVQIVGITTADYCGIENEVIVDQSEVSYVIQGVVKRLEEIVNSPLKKAYISVPISLCEVVKTKGVLSFPQMKEISEDDVKNVCEVAKFSVGKEKDIIQVDIEDYIVGEMNDVKNPIGMKTKILQSEGNAFILSNKYIDGYTSCLDKLGIEIQGWVVNSIGMAKDILEEKELKDGVAIIDVGNSNIEVTVFKDKKFLDFLSIPFGGKTITSDISICLKLSRKDSERLKVKCNTLLKDSSTEGNRIKINTDNGRIIDVNYAMLVDVICERVKELLEMIHNHIEEEGLENQIGSYVIVGGGIALFRDVTLVAKDVLEKPVRVGTPNYVGAANPIYATATGIVSDVLKSSNQFLKAEETLKEEQNPIEDNELKNENNLVAKIRRFLKSFSNEEVIK